jgi:pSer/pThr/pTyr-binding forkhead associated (FHA) protein
MSRSPARAGRFLLFAPPLPPRPLAEGRTFSIGRALACDLPLSSPAASRRHAEVFPGPGGWGVRDLGSTNGTFLNGERLTAPRALAPGDVIGVGAARITFCHLEAELPGAGGDERTVVAAAPVEGLRGEFAEIPPVGLLQMLELERKSGLLEVEGEGGRARLWIEEGAPVHAESGGTRGLEAALALAMRRAGRFRLAPDPGPPERSIAIPMTELVLEASRRIDEGP